MSVPITSSALFSNEGFSISTAFTSGSTQRISIVNGPAYVTLESRRQSNGIYTSYARIADVKAHDTNGGTCSAGFQFRDLNTEQWDPDGIILGFL